MQRGARVHRGLPPGGWPRGLSSACTVCTAHTHTRARAHARRRRCIYIYTYTHIHTLYRAGPVVRTLKWAERARGTGAGEAEGTRFVLRLFSSPLVPPLSPSCFHSSSPSHFVFFSRCFGRSRSPAYIRNTRSARNERRSGILRIQRSPLGTRLMRGGYSLDETHIPEIVACLIPAFPRFLGWLRRRCQDWSVIVTRCVFGKRNW